jgi:hypothetical protein
MISTISDPKTKRELIQALDKLRNPKFEIHEVLDQDPSRVLERRLRNQIQKL